MVVAIIDNITYDINTTTGFTVVTSSSLLNVIIPATVTYNSVTYSVTQIGVFGNKNLTSLTTPTSVNSILNSAFLNCTKLSSVTLLGSNFVQIGSDVFNGCTSLTSFIIPPSAHTIYSKAFSNCTKLSSVTIANTVKLIKFDAFRYCTALTAITIPSSMTKIETLAFAGCTNLINVIIEDQSNVIDISANSFTNVISTPNSSITFLNTSGYSALSANWKTISSNYANVYYSPTLSNFYIAPKMTVDSDFTITPPDSDSDGAFTYASSNTSVATISGNTITIVGDGSSIITATQAASGNYISGSIQTTFTVYFQITNSLELSDFLNSPSYTYGYVVNDITVDYNLISSTYKVLTGVNGVKISRGV